MAPLARERSLPNPPVFPVRLTHVKLSGFKSFVDPTSIGTPGQLVGIVGPNGCGKSNVIDAVRWVLGESRASALRGESMQDVIFNGAGERKPVGRASVELVFDNSAGRIGGQWGSFVELSIRRVLTREGDSTYYINNLPVRRRDIHDLFLGTGLGPRAYAIIEQGMISRVIEAKPEELRVFLEEAAGVSKYKERRRETEGRLSDTTENLARVEDIRQELGNQLARLEQQAKVAGEFRELEARLKDAQHMLWFSRASDAARARERHAGEAATLANELEAIHAELREAEAATEKLRSEHFAANDVVNTRQGEFYAVNSEVGRLEDQLKYARGNETRLGAQLAELDAEMQAIVAQVAALGGDRERLAADLEAASAASAAAALQQRAAEGEIPTRDAELAAAVAELAGAQRAIAEAEQNLRVAETRRDHHARSAAGARERHARLVADIAAIAPPDGGSIAEVESQLAGERDELAGREARVAELSALLEDAQARQRAAGEAFQVAGRALSDLEAHRQAIAALQDKIGKGGDADAWRQRHGLAAAPALWQALDVDAEWETALEAVLRERFEARAVAGLDTLGGWMREDGTPPRVSLYDASAAAEAARAGQGDALAARVQAREAGAARLVADALAGVRCRDDIAAALAGRHALAPGESFVTPQGHVVTATSVTLFSPDSEAHGAIARRRELDALDAALPAAREAAAAARAGVDTAESVLATHQRDFHAEGLAVASQQRRVHDLALELVELRNAEEARARRAAELGRQRDEHLALAEAEDEARDKVLGEIAALSSALSDRRSAGESLLHARNERDVALAKARERLREAERALHEANYAERSVRDHIAESERRGAELAAQQQRQHEHRERLSGERASIDWTPVEEALQRQLALRGEAEQALAAARDALASLETRLREAGEAKLAAEHKLEPARARIQEVQVKEQSAQFSETQFNEQLAEAGADLAALPDKLKAWGRASLPAEITRINTAIAELGPVNMAALDELALSQERKAYLDRQYEDLTEALSTLQTAIREIDRESRELLKQTFETVNANFAVLFPTLFGGGEAKLVLTGEEILDSGVQIVAQPPGKRNASIHLLSGGEKALTAIALVFALFRLNPAPFCLLDEVDAPLDDPNTERFCRMVREMSDGTQFLFISHNKITMEMANQLVGITMPEPGVSRVVAVDIGEALTLARTATPSAA